MTPEEKQKLDLRYKLIKILAGISDDYAGTLDKLENLFNGNEKKPFELTDEEVDKFFFNKVLKMEVPNKNNK